MSEDKKFCPNCKAMTMEPAGRASVNPEELNQMESAPLVFEGRLTPYQCPVCLHLHISRSSEGSRMHRADFRLLIVVMVFLALLFVWAWLDGVPASAVWRTDPISSQSSKYRLCPA